MSALVNAPGAYRNIDIDAYHGGEICPGPSISSTGLKKLVPFNELRTKGCSPRHYWEGSALNPKRKPQEQTDALRIGAAFHDALLQPEIWADTTVYHFLPEGFDRRQTKAQSEQIARAAAASDDGLCLITANERAEIEGMVSAMRENPLIDGLLSTGEAEITLAYQDAETGVWLRARPDWIPVSRPLAVNVKSDADASYAGFQSSVTKYRYAQSAALEIDAMTALADHLRELLGQKFKVPTNYLHPVVEKPGKGWEPGDYLPTAIWELPPEDIEYGRQLNRRAIRLFADCMSADRWPGYSDSPSYCGISPWARKQIDNAIEKEAA